MEPDRTHLSFPRFILAASGVIAALYAVALLLPWPRMWGFDMLRFLQLPDTFPYAVVLTAAVILVLWRTAGGKLAADKAFWMILAALVLAPSMETFFYGDGPLLIPQIHRYSVHGDYDAALLLNLKSSPLAGALLTFFMTAVPKLTFDLSTALYPFAWLSKFSLLAAALSILVLSRGSRRTYYLAALASTAGVLLLMGEVEFYAPLFAAVSIYIVAGERAAREEGSTWPAVVAFAAGVLSHYMAVILLPSLLFLIARRKYPKLRSWNLRQGLIAAAFLIGGGKLLYIILTVIFPDNRILMPLVPQTSEAGVQHYTLYSLMHILDMVNLLLLLAPLAVVALFVFWKKLLRENGTDTVSAYHALTVLPLIAFVFVLNASLGLARDWDLVAVLGIALLFAAMAAGERSKYRHAVPVLLGLSLLLQLPWLLLHEQPRATAERFASIMQLDDENMFGDYALSGYDALRKFDFGEGDLDRELALTQRMVQLVGYPQHYREWSVLAQKRYASEPDSSSNQLSAMLVRLGMQAERLQYQQRDVGYEISRKQVDSLAQAFGMLAIANQRYKFVRVEVDQIAAQTRDSRPYPALEALKFYNDRRYDSAAVYFRAALAEDFATPTLYLLFGNALALDGKYSASLSRFEEGVRRYPEDGMLRFTLGKYYSRAGIQLERAAELLLWCVENNNPSEHAGEAQALLQQLTR